MSPSNGDIKLELKINMSLADRGDRPGSWMTDKNTIIVESESESESESGD